MEPWIWLHSLDQPNQWGKSLNLELVEMNSMHQVMVYADGNSLEKNINIIHKNKETLLDTSKRLYWHKEREI